MLSWDSKACGRFTAFSRTWVAVFSFGIAFRQSQKGVAKSKVTANSARRVHTRPDLIYCISVRQQFEHQLSMFAIVCDFLTYARATDNDVRLLRFQMTDTQCASFGSSTHS